MDDVALVRISQLQPGMVVQADVLHPVTRQIVLKGGAPLSAQAIAMLASLGLREVSIAARPVQKAALTGPLGNPFTARKALDAVTGAGRTVTPGLKQLEQTLGGQLNLLKERLPKSKDVKRTLELAPVVQEVIQRNVHTVKQLDKAFLETAKVDIRTVDRCVSGTISEIIHNREVLENLHDLRCYDAYTAAHSANVMSLSLVVGLTLGYSFEQLRILGVGALMHDLGKHDVPDAILNKPAKLTDQEFTVMKTHPEHSAHILKDYAWATKDIIEIALYHHEKHNGTGYPRRLAGDRIPQMAMIAAIVDVYDALISRRVYKQPMAPHMVYKIITDGEGTHFDPGVVRAFQKFIVPYPAGAEVKLTSGEVARVMKVNRSEPRRPVVMLEGQIVDLVRHDRLEVVDLHQSGSP